MSQEKYTKQDLINFRRHHGLSRPERVMAMGHSLSAVILHPEDVTLVTLEDLNSPPWAAEQPSAE